MASKLETFYSYLKGRRIAMLGIGMSNAPLVRLFLSKGAHVVACDRRTREELGSVGDELEAAGAELCLGESYLAHLDVDAVFRTPGMKFNLPELEEARRRGVAVTSEMEVFFDVCPCPIIAVTGSDGKTTTTTLISEMLKRQGYRVHLGGNIGRPLLPEIENIRPEDIAAVELSSFQLISMRRSPGTAVITNISPNHLDIHKDMQEYIDAKRNIIAHQDAFGRAVLNLDNPVTAGMTGEVRGQLLAFSRRQEVPYGCFVDGAGVFRMRARGGSEQAVMKTSDILLPGAVNIENYLAAICAVWGRVDVSNILGVARTFTGVEHRNEFVRELDGVKYYNDSIGTSPSRTIRGALSLFDRKIILIAGGSDKMIPFDPLGPAIVDKVKTLVLVGATAPKIEAAVKAAPGYREGTPAILHAESLKKAVLLCRDAAKEGDIVMLSPACASFDQFKNFEERGDYFKNLVNSF